MGRRGKKTKDGKDKKRKEKITKTQNKIKTYKGIWFRKENNLSLKSKTEIKFKRRNINFANHNKKRQSQLGLAGTMLGKMYPMELLTV